MPTSPDRQPCRERPARLREPHGAAAGAPEIRRLSAGQAMLCILRASRCCEARRHVHVPSTTSFVQSGALRGKMAGKRTTVLLLGWRGAFSSFCQASNALVTSERSSAQFSTSPVLMPGCPAGPTSVGPGLLGRSAPGRLCLSRGRQCSLAPSLEKEG